MLVIFFFEKGASKVMPMVLLLKSALLTNWPARLSFGEMAEFLQAAVFVSCETLVQSVEVKAEKVNIRNSKAVM